jgi:hypothetical protein
MRGLLSIACVLGFTVFTWLSKRALNKSERHSARARWCHEHAKKLSSDTFDRSRQPSSSTRQPGESP